MRKTGYDRPPVLSSRPAEEAIIIMSVYVRTHTSDLYNQCDGERCFQSMCMKVSFIDTVDKNACQNNSQSKSQHQICRGGGRGGNRGRPPSETTQ